MKIVRLSSTRLEWKEQSRNDFQPTNSKNSINKTADVFSVNIPRETQGKMQGKTQGKYI